MSKPSSSKQHKYNGTNIGEVYDSGSRKPKSGTSLNVALLSIGFIKHRRLHPAPQKKKKKNNLVMYN